MKNRDGRSALLVCLSLAFFCLLISGLPRLIARPQTCPVPVSRAVMHAAVIAAPATQTEQQTGSEAAKAQREDRPVACALRIGGEARGDLLCDANGNVLGHRSYLHTVYRAFALGDGFA